MNNNNSVNFKKKSENIMELKTVQTSVFKQLIEALKDILTDVNFEFNKGHCDAENDSDKGSVKIVAMDPTQTILVHLKLDGKHFEEYYCKQRTIVGISMINFYKLIKTINNNNDCLSLYINENDTNKLGIKIENSDKNSVTNYKINLMDLSHEEVSIPPQSFDNVITMPSSDFQKVCRDMSILTDELEIKNISNKLIFSCIGEFAAQETVFSENGGLTFSGGSEKYDIIQGYYNLKHLVLFTKCTNLSHNVQLFMKNDFPLIIQYRVGSLGYLKLALAPKIHNNQNF